MNAINEKILLEVRNLKKIYSHFGFLGRFEPKAVLKDINFSLESGEILAILGESGSGKSTLARLICGAENSDGGEILFCGKKIELTNLSKRREFYKNIQIVFQDSISAINPSFNVYETISEPLDYLSDFSKSQKTQIVQNLLQKVHLNVPLDMQVAFLSGGMAQRVCIARAMAIKPKIIILDEATSSLDIALQAEILKLISEMKGEFSFIVITHDIRVVRKICDRVIVLENGVIAEICDSSLSNPSSNIVKELIKRVLPFKPKIAAL